MGNMTFGRELNGRIITNNPDLMDTAQVAQEYADLTGESVNIFDGDEFIVEIVPFRVCDGCGSKEIGPTEAECLLCGLLAFKDLWN